MWSLGSRRKRRYDPHSSMVVPTADQTYPTGLNVMILRNELEKHIEEKGDFMVNRQKILDEVFESALQNDMNYFG